jgi:hypothetical protein
MARCAAFLSGLLLLSVALPSAAQVAGSIYNRSALPMVLELNLSGWRELVQPSGARAVVQPGECWRVSESARAGQYRAVPQFFDAASQRWWSHECWPVQHLPGGICPRVDDTRTATSGLACSGVVQAMDPREAPVVGWRGPRAPVLRP